MNMYWTELTIEDARALFTQSESSLVAPSDELLLDYLADIVARVREAVAANAANRLPTGGSIPRSMRQAALAILRRDLLLRFDLEISESRKIAAAEAEELIEAVATQKRKVLTEEGDLPSSATSRPEVIAPATVYATGQGIYPG